jgi:hypothetical protein
MVTNADTLQTHPDVAEFLVTRKRKVGDLRGGASPWWACARQQAGVHQAMQMQASIDPW